ncbi:Modifier of snc1 putative isoform 1 [Tripterygium wilfordii]|uniref:Modifier of snc1 putative isoform 1 n=1 Tax=Tripterygium wilfordii TaxID=458696 RepID=A0A7J7CE09_TRIWF|nr:protein MODIFIER OF SNC1 1-like [Tripterygium wilfordii]XP_038683788.1 protein MODIFIER OF SNC1 1-like [Tripterygium wilfordii]XP_038683789.1 protein MODIFIER OF SNC1 1-like [Tripterygium wilfordii]XP_038683790.1 protein MODIFIER OF SNC1 1-like [Tripterygium wilfordii]XP_038683791.1 protein MODIFIER OF SNC1 1-like [Tripterygium wilfordii]XP_038683792.1 protein MODIFIER OF SNC1 1-like [Tripterygium wilfordii]XP_038683793.1 protein MODIFIER OF SNC1 1-like [Tripterygium wilfordii]XP_03868379
MTSNILRGERRWTSARRGGMTVLGKVSVPKPINLPSQRLENHGLDPNVAIVPKGTLSWGSKSSSSATNAWGSSTLSPRTDGGSGSPSHLSTRPSSGGSATRPSTAGSDRAHEANSNTWGSNSRPSSASGALTLTSNQSSLTSLRPHSAETRPGSSQLSRFAEPPSENPGAWGATGTAEKLGVTSSKNDEFSLTSGDFPTLGSEKDNAGRNSLPQGNASINSNAKCETENSWRRDNPPYSEDGMKTSMEKWPVDPPPYHNPNMPPPHYDAWHGLPVNNHPGGIWYRGPPGGPPYGAPVTHGGFPMEPFHYYRPQIPATALANQHPGPPPSVGPRMHHPKNGDMYKPLMPDAYIRPGMPIRPGFFPGPVAYESYYVPPMVYCNSHERDIPFMEMTAGPSAHNRHSGQSAPDNSNLHSRPCGYGPPGKPLVSEQAESSHSHDTCGPHKVLLKQHAGWDEKHDQKCNESSASYLEKEDQSRKSSWDDDWQGDYKKDEEVNIKGGKPGEEASVASDVQGGSSVTAKLNSTENVGYVKAQDEDFVKKSENMTFVVPEGPAALKDSSLIQKIEGLNAKVRASDGRQDVTSVSIREEQTNKLPACGFKANHPSNDAGIGPVYLESSHVGTVTKSVSRESGVHAGDTGAGDKSFDASVTATSRRPAHGMNSRADHRGSKGRFNLQEADGWQKKSSAVDFPIPAAASQSETSVSHMQNNTSVEPTEKSGSYPQGKNEREAVSPIFDSGDSQLQHAKMRELAKQRVKQRQKEQEERAREQKAKALAKLEELNKRTLAMEGLNQKAETGSTGSIQTKHEESQVSTESTLVASKSAELTSTAFSNTITVVQISDCSATRVLKPAFLVGDLPVETLKSTNRGPVVSVDVSASIEVVASEMASSLKLSESSGQPRRKNNRGGKNKYKADATSSMAVVPSSLSMETNILDTPADASNLMAEESALNPSSIQSVSAGQDSNEPSEPHLSLPNEDTHGRVNSQWKLQHARRMRNQQGNRSAEKFHGGDAVVWAPVRSQNMAEVANEVGNNSVTENTNSVKNDQLLQNNPRNKRAEMERYIPKPVAKEMALQESLQQPVALSTRQTVSEEIVGRPVSPAGPAIWKGGPVIEAGNRDIKQKRPGKVHGSWRQRGSAESSIGQSLQDRKYNTSNSSNNVPKYNENQQPQKSNVSLMKEQPKHTDEWGSSDGWYMPENPESSDGGYMPENSESSAPVTVYKVKDQGVKGKRHSTKGKKGLGNMQNQDQKRIKSDEDMDKSNSQSVVPVICQIEFPAALKENRGNREQSTSHWQPKLQASSAPNQGTTSNIGQGVGAEVGRGNRRDPTFQDRKSLPPQQRMETMEAGIVQSASLSEKSKVEEAPGVRHPEAKRERKISSVKGQSHSPNEVPGGLGEQEPSSNMGFQHEESSFRFQKNGSRNSHFGREHESRGHWGAAGQDNRQHNQPANRDRQRNTSHYEYQPVGPQTNNKTQNLEQSKDASHNSGLKSRDRGQNNSRRGGGNFYGRQSSTSTV